jgi:hypothetical protein
MTTAEWKNPIPQPTTPFSDNVILFKFGDALHHDLREALNVQGHSRNARVKTHRNSAGILWDGQPFYWCSKGFYRGGRIGFRCTLQKLVWQKKHRRKVPPAHVVVFKDGNHNNFSPENLEVKSKAQIALGNQRHISFEKRQLIRGTGWDKQAKKQASFLLNKFNRGEVPAFAAKLRRKK